MAAGAEYRVEIENESNLTSIADPANSKGSPLDLACA